MPTTQTHAIEIAAARAQWHPQGAYLNTASYGLPPDAGVGRAAGGARRLARRAHELGALGRGDRERARATFAALVGVPPEAVAIGATVSELVGLVAASLPDGARVLAPDIDFTSVLFPFLAQERRGVRCGPCRSTRLADAIDARTDVVAFSAVQMATGEVADLDAIAEAAAAPRRVHGRRRDPGVRLAPARRARVRRRRLPRLQVADVAARHRVHDRAARAA